MLNSRNQEAKYYFYSCLLTFVSTSVMILEHYSTIVFEPDFGTSIFYAADLISGE